jgi:hypothetical protein
MVLLSLADVYCQDKSVVLLLKRQAQITAPLVHTSSKCFEDTLVRSSHGPMDFRELHTSRHLGE